tara:strand:+ start:1751 stop:2044 length:294 start_codon:yes stop_codon:yes gene_type:complete
MKNILSSSFAISVPCASVIFSILYMIFNNTALFILAAICAALPALIFLCVAVYILFQFGRHSFIEVELDAIQLGLIQLATLLLAINSGMFFLNDLNK